MQRALACSRPGPPTTRSGGLRGRRTPSGRRATTRSTPQPTAQPCQPSLRLPAAQTGRKTEHSAQHTPAARAQHTQTRARPQHAHVHSTRASHASAAPHTEHTCPHQQQPACHNPHLTHTRAHSPTAGARIGRRREEPEEPESRLEPLRDPDLDPSRPQADSLKASRHQPGSFQAYLAPFRHQSESSQALS